MEISGQRKDRLEEPGVRPPAGAWGGGTGPVAMALIVVGFVVIWALAITLAVRILMLPAGASGRVFVIFPPGTGENHAWQAVIAAGGSPIGPAVGSWTFEAHGEDTGFVGRLHERGALAVLRESPFGMPLAGCLGSVQAPEMRPSLSPGL